MLCKLLVLAPLFSLAAVPQNDAPYSLLREIVLLVSEWSHTRRLHYKNSKSVCD
jgi:hypothetical protein